MTREEFNAKGLYDQALLLVEYFHYYESPAEKNYIWALNCNAADPSTEERKINQIARFVMDEGACLPVYDSARRGWRKYPNPIEVSRNMRSDFEMMSEYAEFYFTMVSLYYGNKGQSCVVFGDWPDCSDIPTVWIFKSKDDVTDVINSYIDGFDEWLADYDKK